MDRSDLQPTGAPRDKADTVNLGANRYLRKPSRLEELLQLGAVFKAAIGGDDV